MKTSHTRSTAKTIFSGKKTTARKTRFLILASFILIAVSSTVAFSSTSAASSFAEFIRQSIAPYSAQTSIQSGDGKSKKDIKSSKLRSLAPDAVVADSAISRQGHTATYLKSGNVLIVGGDAGGTAEILDTATGMTAATGSLTVGRSAHTATKISDEQILITGGTSSGAAVATTEIFDSSNGKFRNGATMNQARAGHTATTLKNGKILIAGGDQIGSSEIYDAANGTFTAIATMTTARSNHSAILMNDNRVLIVGGKGLDGEELNSAEIFDPATSSFTATGNQMAHHRTRSVLRVLPDGKVQIIGGNDDASMEIYDPAIDTIGAHAHVIPTNDEHDALLQSDILSAPTRAAMFHNGQTDALLDRSNFTVTELDGKALIIGGVDTNGNVLSSSTLLNSSNATVTTDKLDYQPGQTAVISGTGWQAGETVNIILHEDPHTTTERRLTVKADANGNFSGNYSVEERDLNVTFIIGAKGQTSGKTAQTTFTDASSNITQIGFVASTTALTAGQSSGALTIQTQNNSVPSPTPEKVTNGSSVTIQLTSNSSTGKFDAASNGTFSDSSINVTVASGSSNADFYYKDTATGTVIITATVINKGNTNLSVGSSPPASTATLNKTINPAGVAKLAFSQQPSSSASGAAISPPVTVRIEDQFGNLTTSTRNVSLAIGTNPSSGTLSNATVAAVAGVATFNNLSINNAGNGYTLVAGSASPAPALTAATSNSFNVISTNAAPTINRDNATVTINEGATAGNTGTWSDTNAGDTVTLSASIGTVTKFGTNAGGTWSWSYPTTDNAAVQIVTITANDGTTTSNTTFGLTLNNVAPTATFNAPSSVDSGSSFNLSLTNPVEPSSVDATSLQYAFDCGDGVGYGAFGASSSKSCTNTVASGTRNVKGKIKDKDGGENEYAQSLIVRASTSLNLISGSGIYGGTATLTAKLTSGATNLSGKTVSFTLNASAVCGEATSVACPATDANGVATLPGISLSGINAGNYPNAVGASFVADANFGGSGGSGALNVAKANQTITFNELTNKNFGDADFTVSATASSTLTVSFAATAGNCSMANTNTVHINGAGSCQITAAQAGDTNYNAAASVPQTFNIGKATQAITWNNPSDITYGTALSATQLNATVSGIAGDTATGALTYTPTTGVKLGAGNNQTLSVTAAATGNYNAASKDVQINVNRAVLTFKADNQSKIFGEANPSLTYTPDGYVGGDSAATAFSGLPTVSTNANADSAAGNYPITILQGTLSSANYSFVFTDGVLSVGKRSTATSVSSGSPSNTSSYGNSVMFTATVAGIGAGAGNPADGQVQFFDGGTLLGLPQTLNGGTTSINTSSLSVGAHSITAIYSGNDNFKGSDNAASPLSQTVSKATPVIVWNAPAAITYGTALGAAQLNATANVAGTFAYTPESGTILNAGGNQTLSVLFTPNDTTNYENAPATTTITVNPAGTTTTVNVADAIYDGNPHGGTANVTGAGNLNESLTVKYTGRNGTIYSSTSAPIGAGSYTASASFAGDANHAESSDSKDFSITKKATGIVGLAAQTLTYGNSIAQTATVSGGAGGETIVYTLASGLNATSGFDIYTNPVNAGDYTLKASYAGDANYLAAEAVANVAVGKAGQTINFTALAGKTFGDTPFTVGASGGASGNAVTFNASPAAVCASGGTGGATITIVSAGDCTVTAAQAGNSNFDAAPSVSQSFTIAKATATLALIVADLNQTYNGSPRTVGYTINPNIGTVSVTYDNANAAPTGAGNYAVVAKLTNNNYQANDATGMLIIGKAGQMIDFGVLANKTFNDADFTITATSNSNLTVSFAASPNSNCTISGNSVHIIGAGSCAITASQAGDANYNAAAPVERSFGIAKAPATITFDNLSQTYNGVGKSVTTVTSPANLAVNTVYSQNGNTIASPTDAGSYEVHSVINDANYEGSASGTLVIGKASATIALSNKTYTYDGSAKSVTITTTPNGLSGVSVTYDNSATAPTNAGSFAVVAKLNNPNFELAEDSNGIRQITGTLVIEKAEQSITWKNPSAITYGTLLGDGQLNATVIGATGGSSVGALTYTPPARTLLNFGSHTLSVEAAATNNYKKANATIALQVNARQLTITADDKSKTFGYAIVPFTVRYNGFVNNENESKLIGTLVYNFADTSDTSVGTHIITPSGLSSSNYAINFVSGKLTVYKRKTAIVFNGPTITTFGTCIPFSATLTDIGDGSLLGIQNAAPVSGAAVKLQLGTILGAANPVTSNTSSEGIATAILSAYDNPGNVEGKASFAGDATREAVENVRTVTINPGAVGPVSTAGFYTGESIFWTTGTSSSTATLTLSATIKDISSNCEGDIRKARVTFAVRNSDGITYTPINGASNLPVGLANPGDLRVGTASAVVQYNLGNADAATLNVAILVSGNYKNNNPATDAIIGVSKPITGQIIGDGSLSATNSRGYLAGAANEVTKFGFDVKYNKSGTNPQGSASFIVRSFNKPDGSLDIKLHTYLIKSNSITSLSVVGSKATFSSKANITEQTIDPVTGLITNSAVDGGAILQLAMTDGASDKLAVTLQNKSGGLWFSNNWDGTKTVEQALNSGNVSVK